MKIDESMITSEPKPKNPLYLHYANVSCNDYGESEIESSLAITLDSLDSFIVNRQLTIEEAETLTKNGFIVTSTTAYYDNTYYCPPIRKAVIETHVERIHSRVN